MKKILLSLMTLLVLGCSVSFADSTLTKPVKEIAKTEEGTYAVLGTDKLTDELMGLVTFNMMIFLKKPMQVDDNVTASAVMVQQTNSCDSNQFRINYFIFLNDVDGKGLSIVGGNFNPTVAIKFDDNDELNLAIAKEVCGRTMVP